MGAEPMKLNTLKPPKSKIRWKEINLQELIYKALVLKRMQDRANGITPPNFDLVNDNASN